MTVCLLLCLTKSCPIRSLTKGELFARSVADRSMRKAGERSLLCWDYKLLSYCKHSLELSKIFVRRRVEIGMTTGNYADTTISARDFSLSKTWLDTIINRTDQTKTKDTSLFHCSDHSHNENCNLSWSGTNIDVELLPQRITL